MKLRQLLAPLTFAIATIASAATSTPDLSTHADPSAWSVHNRAASAVPDQPQALRLDARDRDGVAWLVGSEFANGTLELDLRSADKPGQSFVGLAFRGIDDSTYEAIYFRPFNFKNPDPARAARAVQYISHPQHPWQVLREKFPGKYEAAISPVPNPNDWFHARIVLSSRTISVFVNDAKDPCLTVESLSDRTSGRIGLWVGNASSGDFANLKITPSE